MRISSAMGRDIPLMVSENIPTIAAGSAADTSLVIGALPDLTLSFLPSALNEGIQSQLPINSLSVRQASFVSGGAANTVGNATNNCEYRLNVYRKGALQGAVAFLSMAVATTVGTAVSATGVQTVTPAAMTNIVAGMPLLVGTSDLVYVISTTATTFTANFGATHANTDAVTSILIPWRPVSFVPALGANTATGGSITAGANKVVTPTSMHGIHVGDSLLIDTVASTFQETVVVSAVTDTTFTASFANAHTGSVPAVAASNAPFVVKGGDVLVFERISNNVTGLATPIGMFEIEFVPSSILR